MLIRTWRQHSPLHAKDKLVCLCNHLDNFTAHRVIQQVSARDLFLVNSGDEINHWTKCLQKVKRLRECHQKKPEMLKEISSSNLDLQISNKAYPIPIFNAEDFHCKTIGSFGDDGTDNNISQLAVLREENTISVTVPQKNEKIQNMRQKVQEEHTYLEEMANSAASIQWKECFIRW